LSGTPAWRALRVVDWAPHPCTSRPWQSEHTLSATLCPLDVNSWTKQLEGCTLQEEIPWFESGTSVLLSRPRPATLRLADIRTGCVISMIPATASPTACTPRRRALAAVQRVLCLGALTPGLFSPLSSLVARRRSDSQVNDVVLCRTAGASRLASVSSDRSVRLWNLDDNGQEAEVILKVRKLQKSTVLYCRGTSLCLPWPCVWQHPMADLLLLLWWCSCVLPCC
jgi:WD40 repeat protein